MIDYATTVGSIVVATLVPAYVALYLFANLKRLPMRYLAAAGVGLAFWLFFDNMGDASKLDADMAIYPIDQFGGYVHIAVIVTFIAGITVLAIFDRFAVPKPTATSATGASDTRALKALVLIPIAVAAVTGIHGLGEGWNFATTASQSSTSSIVDTFGTIAALVSYPIHKFLEAAIVGAVYSAYVVRGDSGGRKRWHLPVLGLLFGLTSVIGASIGYYVSADTTYFFAFGVTSPIYAMLRLVGPVFPKFATNDRAALYLGPKVFLSVAIGIFAFYTAALLH